MGRGYGQALKASGAQIVVAVPARDEADRIGACLGALLDQRDLSGQPLAAGSVRILVLANNCTDDTAAAARRISGPIEVIEETLPPSSANAGAARRWVMDAAADRLSAGHAGLICTTDADSRPRPDWIARLQSAVSAGAEAVAGAVDFDPQEKAVVGFSEARRRESHYSALQAEITAHTDPEAHNPWPNHIWAWGANLAVTASAYRRVGGLPPKALAEDRAFVEALRLHDIPVRHCLEARVWTSARRVGRAEGGLASLVDDHAGQDCAPCDAALEPARSAWRRAAWRRRWREAYAEGFTSAAMALRLDVARETLQAALAEETCGAGWRLLEGASPSLVRRRLAPADLPLEISRAERLLRRIAPPAPSDQSGRARAASAGLWSSPPTSG